jgi:hypothetical protein
LYNATTLVRFAMSTDAVKRLVPSERNKDRGALKVESDFALLADFVIIIVESPGSFAERNVRSAHISDAGA